MAMGSEWRDEKYEVSSKEPDAKDEYADETV